MPFGAISDMLAAEIRRSEPTREYSPARKRNVSSAKPWRLSPLRLESWRRPSPVIETGGWGLEAISNSSRRPASASRLTTDPILPQPENAGTGDPACPGLDHL